MIDELPRPPARLQSGGSDGIRTHTSRKTGELRRCESWEKKLKQTIEMELPVSTSMEVLGNR